MTLTSILTVVSMHTEVYDITYLVKNDNVGKIIIAMHITPKCNPHYVDKMILRGGVEGI